MIDIVIIIMIILATSIIAHLRIRSYLIASIAALFIGPLISCFALYIISGGDSETAMWLPVVFIFMTLYSSPAPFVLGPCVRMTRRLYWKTHSSCFKCGHKMNSDITQPCSQCSWQQERICKGLCPICTYDLRSNFTKGCSECGWRRGASL